MEFRRMVQPAISLWILSVILGLMTLELGRAQGVPAPEMEVTVNQDSVVTPVADGGTVLLPDTKIDFSTSGRLMTVTVKNTGTANLTGLQVTKSGANMDQFSHVSALGSSLAPGASGTVRIYFRPYSSGVHSATFHITTNDEDESPYDIHVQGRGGIWGLEVELADGTPVSSFSDARFPDTALGMSSTLTLVLKNVGTLPASLDTMITGAGLYTADFTITTPPEKPLLPGGSTTMLLTFTPTGQGGERAEVNLSQGSEYFGYITLRGQVLDSVISFAQPVYEVNQGATEAVITLKRTNPGASRTGRVYIGGYSSSSDSVPRFVPGLPDEDFVPKSNGGYLAVFAEGESETTVVIPLIPQASRAKTNLLMKVWLSSQPSWEGAYLRVLGADTVKPTLTLTTPAAGRVTGLSPLAVTGKAADPALRRVEVRLNADAPVDATLQPTFVPTNVPTNVPFSVMVSPAEGANVLVVTAYDLRGNFTRITRNFTFTRRRQLIFETRLEGQEVTSAAGGTVTLMATPAAGASAPGAETDPALKRSLVVAGTVVKLVAKAKPGYFFRRWVQDAGPRLTSTTPTLPGTVTFAMPDADVAVHAEFLASPFATATEASVVGVLLRPESENLVPLPAFAQQGCLTGTLTWTGAFSGKVLMGGQTVPVVAALSVGGPTVFTIAGKPHESLPLPGGLLKLRLETNQNLNQPVRAVVSTLAGVEVFTNVARRAPYSSVRKVPAGLMGSATATKRLYTMIMSQLSLETGLYYPEKHPMGTSYATMALTNAGVLTYTGVMADNTTFTLSTPLLHGDVAQIYAPMLTPGGSTKNTLVTGQLGFTAPKPETGEAIQGLVYWYRPAAASTKVTLFPEGWPEGLLFQADGAPYDPAKTVQSALGVVTGTPEQSNATLTFNYGKLVPDLLLSNLSVNKNTVVKHPAGDRTFTLSLSPATGLFSGTFTPNWPQPAAALPAFKGVIVQSYGHGRGFFLTNAKGDTAPQSGEVLLQPNGAAGEPY